MDSNVPLPPPSQLKRKIIIKNKKLSAVAERSPGEVRASGGDDDDPPPTPSESNGFALGEEIERAQSLNRADSVQSEAVQDRQPTPSPRENRPPVSEDAIKSDPKNPDRDNQQETDRSKDDTSTEQAKEDPPKLETKEQEEESKTKESEAGAEISELVNYVQPVHFVSFDESESKCISCIQ